MTAMRKRAEPGREVVRGAEHELDVGRDPLDDRRGDAEHLGLGVDGDHRAGEEREGQRELPGPAAQVEHAMLLAKAAALGHAANQGPARRAAGRRGNGPRRSGTAAIRTGWGRSFVPPGARVGPPDEPGRRADYRTGSAGPAADAPNRADPAGKDEPSRDRVW